MRHLIFFLIKFWQKNLNLFIIKFFKLPPLPLINMSNWKIIRNKRSGKKHEMGANGVIVPISLCHSELEEN